MMGTEKIGKGKEKNSSLYAIVSFLMSETLKYFLYFENLLKINLDINN
jgi:hypothetical protein